MMNAAVGRQAWAILGRGCGQLQQWRGIRVMVFDGNLDHATKLLQRKMQSSGMERLIRKEVRHHVKNSEKRVLARKDLHAKLRAVEMSRKMKTILIQKVRGSS